MRIAVILHFCISFLIISSALPASGGDWPMLRGDIANTGRSVVKGNIKEPAVRDKIFAGEYEALVVVTPAAKARSLVSLPRSETNPDYMSKHASEWNSDGVFALPADDPRAKYPDSPAERYANFIPDAPGLQKVHFDNAAGGNPEQKGYLFALDGLSGRPGAGWQTEPEKDMYAPTLLVLDADGNDLPEVVVATHFRVMIFNGQTGAKKLELRWHGMRNYGFFGSFMVPGDPYPKFVVIADFVSHIDVLDRNSRSLYVLWSKNIETTIIRKQKITRPGPNPIADIDGDGRQEITLNIYNDTGDHKWHVVSFDALTGKVRFDLPDTYMHGLADASGDGIPEIFAGEARGLAVPRFSLIRLISIKGGKQTVLWSHERACWQTTKLSHLPLTANTMAADGNRTVLVGSRKRGAELYVVADKSSAEGDRRELLVIAADSSGKWAIVYTALGPVGAYLEVKSVRRRAAGNELLLAVRSAEVGKRFIECNGAKATVVSWRTVSAAMPVPIVARLRAGNPTVIFQRGYNQVEAVQNGQGAWRTLWRQSGRGTKSDGPPSVVAIDLNNDGALETLFARSSQSGEAELVAVDPDGKRVWSHVFTGFDGAAPISGLGGLTYWTVGHFTASERYDVFVSLRRSTMHSDEGYCLSGIDGKTLWHQDGVFLSGVTDPEEARGYAGRPVAVADLNSDGLDELVCEYPDRFWIASGKTGEVTYIAKTSNGIFGSSWVAYATPIVADFLGNGKSQILWGGCQYLRALLSSDGAVLWKGKPDAGPPYVMQGLGGVDEAGKLSIGEAHSRDFHCLDAASGTEKWTYSLAEEYADPGSTITADVDGDRVDEFLFTSGQTLYALNGKGGKANLVWSLPLSTMPSSLAYADADGDGWPEILFGGSDGYIYLVGQKTTGIATH